MNLVTRFLTYCRMTFGGSSKGTGHTQYAEYSRAALKRRYGSNGVLSIAEDFSRFPAGRTKADGRHSGEHLREVVLQRLREGALTILFDDTQGYGSSFLQGAFAGLAKEVSVEHLHLNCSDTSIITEVWSYINS